MQQAKESQWAKENQGEGVKVADLHSINEHRDSAGHRQAVSRQAGADALRAGFQVMEEAEQARVESTRHIIVAAAYWLAIQKLAGSHLPQLLLLLRLVKAEGFSPGGAFQYDHHRYFISSIYALSDMLLQQQLQRLRTSPYFTVMLDESTDLANLTQVRGCIADYSDWGDPFLSIACSGTGQLHGERPPRRCVILVVQPRMCTVCMSMLHQLHPVFRLAEHWLGASHLGHGCCRSMFCLCVDVTCDGLRNMFVYPAAPGHSFVER